MYLVQLRIFRKFFLNNSSMLFGYVTMINFRSVIGNIIRFTWNLRYRKLPLFKEFFQPQFEGEEFICYVVVTIKTAVPIFMVVSSSKATQPHCPYIGRKRNYFYRSTMDGSTLSPRLSYNMSTNTTASISIPPKRKELSCWLAYDRDNRQPMLLLSCKEVSWGIVGMTARRPRNGKQRCCYRATSSSRRTCEYELTWNNDHRIRT